MFSLNAIVTILFYLKNTILEKLLYSVIEVENFFYLFAYGLENSVYDSLKSCLCFGGQSMLEPLLKK